MNDTGKENRSVVTTDEINKNVEQLLKKFADFNQGFLKIVVECLHREILGFAAAGRKK